MMHMQETIPYKQESITMTETIDDSLKTTFVSGVTTRLLVRGYADNFSLDDLWTVFSYYGTVSNIIIEQHGATVTYKDQSIFPELEFNVDMELVVGENTMIFTKLSQAVDTGADQYPDQYPAPVYYPHHPPPLSPHYDTAILDVGQSQYAAAQYPTPGGHHQYTVPPPPLPGHVTQPVPPGNVFTFDHVTPDTDVTKRDHGCHVCSAGGTEPVKQLQPLTPITPTYPYPPPSFYLPPPAQSASSTTLMSLSGTSLISTDSSSYVVPIGSDVGINRGTGGGGDTKQTPARANSYQYFTSPYKKFSKFQGVPTPAKFPLVINNGGGLHTSSAGDHGDDKRWYQAGDRWGHKRQQARSFSQSDIGEVTASINKSSVKNKVKEPSLEGISNLSLN